jgi:7-dehydrocholesterol reductase
MDSSSAATSAISHLHSKNANKRAARTPLLKQLGDHVPSSLQDGKAWGRQGGGRSWLGSLLASAPVVVGPLTSISTYITLTVFGGSYAEFLAAVMKEGFWNICVAHGPQPTLKCALALICWVAFQALLFMYLPGEVHTGQYTPAGHLLSYRINGLSAWIVSNVVYGVFSWYGIIDPGFIPRNWGGLIAVMNIAGLTVSALAFIKAYLHPTHPNDRKFSGMLHPHDLGLRISA